MPGLGNRSSLVITGPTAQRWRTRSTDGLARAFQFVMSPCIVLLRNTTVGRVAATLDFSTIRHARWRSSSAGTGNSACARWRPTSPCGVTIPTVGSPTAWSHTCAGASAHPSTPASSSRSTRPARIAKPQGGIVCARCWPKPCRTDQRLFAGRTGPDRCPGTCNYALQDVVSLAFVAGSGADGMYRDEQACHEGPVAVERCWLRQIAILLSPNSRCN